MENNSNSVSEATIIKSQTSSFVGSPKTWSQRLAEAEKRKRFTDMDVKAAKRWGSCVMSTRKEFLYRSVEEEELTEEAVKKGTYFGLCVEEDRISDAKKYCEEILNMKVVLRPEEHSEFLEESRKYPIV